MLNRLMNYNHCILITCIYKLKYTTAMLKFIKIRQPYGTICKHGMSWAKSEKMGNKQYAYCLCVYIAFVNGQ